MWGAKSQIEYYQKGRVAEVGRLSANTKNVFYFSLGAYLLIGDNKLFSERYLRNFCHRAKTYKLSINQHINLPILNKNFSHTYFATLDFLDIVSLYAML